MGASRSRSTIAACFAGELPQQDERALWRSLRDDAELRREYALIEALDALLSALPAGGLERARERRKARLLRSIGGDLSERRGRTSAVGPRRSPARVRRP